MFLSLLRVNYVLPESSVKATIAIWSTRNLMLFSQNYFTLNSKKPNINIISDIVNNVSTSEILNTAHLT